MNQNIYHKIEVDSIFHESARILLKEIKEFSKIHFHEKFEPGDLTRTVLENLLKKFKDNNSDYGILIKVAIHEYLDLEPVFEIGLKAK